MNNFKNKKILVTGGSGFIASHLVRRLLHADAQVAITTKYNSVMDNIRLVSCWDKLIVLEADLRNTDALTQIKDFKPSIIYHFAAYNHVGDSFLQVQESLQSNLIGTANLFESYENYDRFVYISTSESYGYQTEMPFEEGMLPFPTSPYSVGKYAGELYAKMKWHVKNLPIVFLRPFNAFGPYQSPRAIISELILKCLKGAPIETTEGKQTRDFNFVENLVDGFIETAFNENAIGKTMNIGSGREIAIRDLVKMIHAFTESKSELRVGALANRPTEIWRMGADSSIANEVIGWTPKISLEEGLKLTISWYRDFLKIYSDPNSPLMKL